VAKKISTIPPRLLGVQDFANELGVSVWTARTWAYEGRIASVKIGSRLKIPYGELDRLIQKNLRPAIHA
jgi:excisionase family DNA binding protein